MTVLGQSQFAAHTPGTGPVSSSALNTKELEEEELSKWQGGQWTNGPGFKT